MVVCGLEIFKPPIKMAEGSGFRTEYKFQAFYSVFLGKPWSLKNTHTHTIKYCISGSICNLFLKNLYIGGGVMLIIPI